ncbi:hypothetical protein tinsulaeT_14540 [Thalassotalea insulae]|uniref:PAS domain-containing protein n=2 Tax=Thalassotalea insulae TaxID=2056778 RepID=A0ABQ6GSH2_9GAMM|nr:hypothetical protein tinsulaeT_14540 [Thalassotalea insulae]
MPVTFTAEEYLNKLPFGAAIVKNDSQTLNHKITFINEQFKKDIGWSLAEVPDKNSWWITAYPDEDYQKVVAAQWELVIESFDKSKGNYVSMEVNIRTKFNGTVRYRVYSEVCNYLIPDHYIVMFTPLDQSPTN